MKQVFVIRLVIKIIERNSRPKSWSPGLETKTNILSSGIESRPRRPLSINITLQKCVICPQKGGGRVCEYMHAWAIFNVGPTNTNHTRLQKGGLNPQPPANHTHE